MVPNRIHDTLQDFAGNTTLHGINRISSSKHVIGKLLWTCIVLTCVALCFRQIYTLGVQYGSYSKMEEHAFEWDGDIFTSLVANRLHFEHKKIVAEIDKQFEDSAASYDKLKKGEIRAAFADSNDSPAVDLDVDPILRASGKFRLSMSNLGRYGSFEQATEKVIKDLTADFSDFVIYCDFEGRQCNESVFVPFFDNYYGLCYTFPPEPIITKRAGPLFALHLLINVNQSDYVPYIASEAGIRLSIHEHGSQPYLENNAISVATGFKTDVSLVQVGFILVTVTKENRIHSNNKYSCKPRHMK
ncbi:unnamed protein product [Mytilus coruscus]|uniref:SCNN1B n=1 Tax=Mytilus coruscus TaxID=42192 RepID=A0A6J8E400_MYTCO|nr:unnamed protein product [Mytilus coruscus]